MDDRIFHRKSENRGIKIARVNLILITKSTNSQLFIVILQGVGVRCDPRRFSVLSPLVEKSMIRENSFVSIFKNIY